LLDLEKQIFNPQGPQMIASQSAGQTLEQVRRDVYDSHRHRAFALAFYMTGNEVEAEQILIRTFTRVFSSPEAPDGAAVDAALFDELRQGGVLPACAPQESAPPTVTRDGQSVSSEGIRRTDLEEALQQLPPNLRMVFLLRDVEGYTPGAIASLMGCPEEEVRRTVVHARLQLRLAVAKIQKKRQEAA
jgi:RNA polymerase sigma-70 factor (ECF subfamily)